MHEPNQQFDLFGQPPPSIKADAARALWVYTDGYAHPDETPRIGALLRRAGFIVRVGDRSRITKKGKQYLRGICRPDKSRNITEAMLKGYV